MIHQVILFALLSCVPCVLSSIDLCNTNFTIKCNFEDCLIPGQYCDQSDEDFFRCATCDEDVCNGGLIPGECTIPCLKYAYNRDGKFEVSTTQEQTTHHSEVYCDTEKGQEYLIGLAISAVINIILMIWVSILMYRRHTDVTAIQVSDLKTMEPDTNMNDTNSKIVPSSSLNEISIQKSYHPPV